MRLPVLVLSAIAGSRLIGPRTVVIATHSSRRTLEPAYGSLRMLKERRHGDSCIATYPKESTQ